MPYHSTARLLATTVKRTNTKYRLNNRGETSDGEVFAVRRPGPRDSRRVLGFSVHRVTCTIVVLRRRLRLLRRKSPKFLKTREVRVHAPLIGCTSTTTTTTAALQPPPPDILTNLKKYIIV